MSAPAAHVRPLGLCLECNYALLREMPEHRCPECGRAFDPNDLATVNRGKPLSPLARWVLGPVTWKAMLVVLTAIAYTLWHARLPRTGRTIEPKAMVAIWSILAALWLAWPVLRVIVARRNGWRLSIITAGRRSRWWVGILMVVLVVALAQQWPLRASFAWARPRMDALARRMMENKKMSPRDQWIGPYQMTEIKRIPNGVRFTARRGDGYEAGFVYLPDVNQSRQSWSSYRAVGGNWWTWFEEVP